MSEQVNLAEETAATTLMCVVFRPCSSRVKHTCDKLVGQSDGQRFAFKTVLGPDNAIAQLRRLLLITAAAQSTFRLQPNYSACAAQFAGCAIRT